MNSKESDKIQSEVFTNLINSIMLPQGIQINDLNELNQGAVLPKFTQILLGEEIQGWKDIPDAWKNKPIFKQRIVSQASANLSAILKHLSTKDNAFKFMKTPESEKDLISFLWLLISKFYIVHPKRSLINIINQHLKDHEPAFDIKNMSSSWENGLPFIALLSKASKGTIEYSDKGDAQSNFNYIKESCQTINIPFVLTEKCISDKPEENCICIQAIIILKSIGGDESTAQQTTNNEGTEKKKFDEKIDEYKKKLQNAIDAIDAEQVQIDKYSDCFSKSDIEYKRKYIHEFNSSKKKTILELYYFVRDSWSTLERNSNRTKIPIPSDLTTAEEIKQKIDNLEEKIKKQNENLDSDEKRLKELNDDINNISTIREAKEKYNELKTKIDMDNWEQFSHNHIAYILGKKLQTYESDLKETIEKFEKEKEKFESIRNSIINQIENNSDDLIALEKSVRSLDDSFYNVKRSFNSIKKLDESTNVDFSEEELKSKLERVKNMFDENKTKLSKISFEKEYESISNKYEQAKNEIEKLDEYKNVYSSDLINLAKSEHHIEIPKYNKLEILLKEMDEDEENNNKFEKIKNMIDSLNTSYDEAFVFLNSREEESKKIEEISKLVKKKCKKFNNEDLEQSVVIIGEVRSQFHEIENLNKWDEESKGSTIDYYNECMKEATEIIKNGTQIIEDKFYEYLEQLKQSIESVKEKRMKETENYKNDLGNYKKGLNIIEDDINKFGVLKLCNEKMNFDKKEELDEIETELNETKETLVNLIDGFDERMKHIVEKEIEFINSYNTKELIDQLKTDNSNLDEMEIEEIDNKGTKYILYYVEILEKQQIIDEYNKDKLEYDIEPITDTLHDLIILYKSTFLLSPFKCSEKLSENLTKCDDPIFSFSMTLLYLHKFIKNENNKYEIENNEDKDKDESSDGDGDDDSKVNIYKLICELAKEKSFLNQVKLNILCDFIEYLPDFEDKFKDYLTTSVSNSPEITTMIDNLEEMKHVPTKLIDIYKSSLDKVNSLVKGKLCDTKKEITSSTAIIVDFGAFETRVGIEGELNPRFVFPTTVSTNKYKMSLRGEAEKKYGLRAYSNTGGCVVDYPIKHGYVTNWDDMEELIRHEIILNGSEYSERPLLCSEPIKSIKSNREKWTQILFEKFSFPSICLVNSNVLSLLSTGRYTGFVANCGFDRSTFSPIYEGYSIPSQTTVQLYGGKDVTDLFVRELGRTYEILKSSSSIEIVEKIKREKCFVSLDFDKQINNNLYDSYELSDGNFVNIGKEMITSTEYLFNPSINGNNDCDGFHQSLYDSLKLIDIDYRKLFTTNILICGGTSRLKGFQERVKQEMKEIVNSTMKIGYINSEFQENTAWIGGSIMSMLPTFPQMLLSKTEYNDQGPGIIHRKCIF